jgi:hypothetical protein
MHLDVWDYLTFLTFFIVAARGVGLAVFILGLPGRIVREVRPGLARRRTGYLVGGRAISLTLE